MSTAETAERDANWRSFEARKREAVGDLVGTIGRMRGLLRSARDPIARGLAARPAAPAGAEGAYRAVFEHLEAEVAAGERALAAAEDARAAAELRPVELRQERDEAASELSRLVARLQRILVTLPLLGDGELAAGAPAAPVELPAAARSLVELLRRLERDPPPVFGWSLEAGAAAAELETGSWRLEALVEELGTAEAAVVPARQEVMREVGRTDRVASAVSEAMQGLAGLGEDRRLDPCAGNCRD